MKKFITFLIFALFVLTAFGQKETTLSAKDPKGSWLLETNLASSDTIGKNDSIWYYTIFPNKGERLYYDIAINIDSVGGTGGVVGLVPVILKGRRLASDAFTNIDTITWIATASATNDTTIKFSQVSTAQFYTEYQLYIKAKNDDFRALIDWIKARFWY